MDLSVEAVGHCRSKGLHVENQNALSYLRHLPDATLGVITAFHFLEHCPFEMIFFIVREAARTLKPGGLFILEVPNPANSLPAAYEFWRDPTHIRPLPMDLLCFLFQHHGFKQEKILYRNPVDEGQRLPFDQLEFINQLNSLLYGARDYGLIARR